MADVHTPEIRSKNMAAIKGKDTKPELLVRKYLHNAGYRYRIHYKIAGKPDIVFPSKKVAIFIHGCFWHCHGCKDSVMPKTNTEFWNKKLGENVARDKKNIAQLKSEGWRVVIIWNCELKQDFGKAMQRIRGVLTLLGT